MELQYIIALVFLALLSYLDIISFNKKDGCIPAVITTTFIIITFIVAGASGLVTGLFSVLIALLFIDLDIFYGVADLKVFIACGLTLPTILSVVIFAVGISGAGIIYKLAARKITNLKQVPFIPILLIAYLGVLAILLL